MERKVSIFYDERNGTYCVDVYGEGKWKVSKIFKADNLENMSVYIESWLIEGVLT